MTVLIAIAALVAVGFVLVKATGGGSGGGGNLSFSDIEGYASSAGFSGDDLNTAVAIALAESSGNPSAAGDATLGGSYGLWQINLKAHPEYTEAALMDPQTNANAAFAIYQAAGNGFSRWSTFNSGAYAQYLPAASSDQSADATPAPGSAPDDNPDAGVSLASSSTFEDPAGDAGGGDDQGDSDG